jgi:tetratricopeptide (TPR) repeat protein
MKKLFTLSIVCLAAIASFAQVTPKKPVTTPGKNSPHLSVFNQALQSGDIITAISSLNYYISEQNGNTPYADTLAMLYMQQGAFPQCYYWADKRLTLKPEDIALMEMKAMCLDKLNQPTEAITLFDKLFKKTNNPFHAYKLMELQYGLKRLLECLGTAQAAEKLQFKPEYVIPYSVGEQQGRTYLQAGIFNIHALALYDLDKKPEAKMYFEKALQLDSNFVLAKQNLEAMKVTEAAANKTVTNPVVNPSANPAKKD